MANAPKRRRQMSYCFVCIIFCRLVNMRYHVTLNSHTQPYRISVRKIASVRCCHRRQAITNNKPFPISVRYTRRAVIVIAGTGDGQRFHSSMAGRPFFWREYWLRQRKNNPPPPTYLPIPKMGLLFTTASGLAVFANQNVIAFRLLLPKGKPWTGFERNW